MKKYRKFNKTILVALFSILIVVSAFNIIMDPYNVFESPTFGFNRLKPEAKRQERLTKVLALKLDRRKIDAIFLGTSRVDWAFDKDYYKQKTGKEAANMAVVGMIFDEYIDFTKAILQIHPEVKNIYIGLDFYTFNKLYKDNQKHMGFNENKNVTTSELATALFSADTTVSGFITLSRNLFKTDMSKMYDNKGLIYVFENPIIAEFVKHTIRTYYDRFAVFELNKDYYRQLAELELYCKSRGVNLHIFNTTGHVIDLATIYESDRWETFTEWKKDLAQITDVYDFYYITNVNTKPIDPKMTEFYDAAHATPQTGNLMVDKMLGGNGEFGRLNTKDNVDAYTSEDTRKLKKWMKDNPYWIKTIRELKQEKIQEDKNNAI